MTFSYISKLKTIGERFSLGMCIWNIYPPTENLGFKIEYINIKWLKFRYFAELTWSGKLIQSFTINQQNSGKEGNSASRVGEDINKEVKYQTKSVRFYDLQDQKTQLVKWNLQDSRQLSVIHFLSYLVWVQNTRYCHLVFEFGISRSFELLLFFLEIQVRQILSRTLLKYRNFKCRQAFKMQTSVGLQNCKIRFLMNEMFQLTIRRNFDINSSQNVRNLWYCYYDPHVFKKV